MTQPQRVIVTARAPSGIPEFTMVTAEVDGGASGDYVVSAVIVGTEAELEEIRNQSARRMEAIDATGAGAS